MTARGLLRIVCWGDLTANIMARFYFCGKYLEIVGCEIVNLEIDVNLIVTNNFFHFPPFPSTFFFGSFPFVYSFFTNCLSLPDTGMTARWRHAPIGPGTWSRSPGAKTGCRILEPTQRARIVLPGYFCAETDLDGQILNGSGSHASANSTLEPSETRSSPEFSPRPHAIF